ncbi:MAG: methyl-accepting chemotaxis protein [Gemmatimonadaceae bacterium]|nr:methyl-accepting chemotaxis protein [Gemmatimonadaceae bacterium]
MRFGSIRVRLIAGLSLMIVLLFAAGLVGRASIASLGDELTATVENVQREGSATAALGTNVALALAAGQRYLDRLEAADRDAFRNAGWSAHEAQRRITASGGLTAMEIGLVAEIDGRLSRIETGLAAAHRLRELGRTPEAAARAAQLRDEERALTAEIEQLGALRATQVELTLERARLLAAERRQVLLIVVLGAIVLGVVVVSTTTRSITRPLDLLVRHAHALSRGNLEARTDGDLPGEFQELAEAMNHTAASLTRVSGVANSTAEDVATSAQQLTSAAEQVAMAASQTATAMAEVTEGAETQVSVLREADDALSGVRARANDVQMGAEEVAELARAIEAEAKQKRSELDRARVLLGEIRSSVETAAVEVAELTTTTTRINGFVEIVSRIAEQTNLLALNAAIEATRAGAAGRGFSNVAEEVRKLADQAQSAADDVVRLTAAVTRRIKATTEAMATGTTRVGEIDSVSAGINTALTSISGSAELTRQAASVVGEAAKQNATATEAAAAGIAAAVRAAEGHAAAAQQVSASTEEQSAACEEMSSAANALQQGSVHLKDIVSGLRGG